MNVERIKAKLAAKSVRDGDCIRWTGYRSGVGYGIISVDGKIRVVHRVSYELFVGPIPEGLQLDHVVKRGCKFRDCFNPNHLEPVTCRENLLRGNTAAAMKAAQTHCVNGHELTPDNLLPWSLARGLRNCRTCSNARKRAYRAAAKSSKAGAA